MNKNFNRLDSGGAGEVNEERGSLDCGDGRDENSSLDIGEDESFITADEKTSNDDQSNLDLNRPQSNGRGYA